MNLFNEISRLKKRAQTIQNSEGTINALKSGLDKLQVYASYPVMCQTLKNKTVEYNGKLVPLYVHHYNATWRNERALEIALTIDFIKRMDTKKILELGNVLYYYGVDGHAVVDKYEPSSGTIKEDFVSFVPEAKFDSFVSVSTFEHIGWDESPRDHEKALKCYQRLASMVVDPSRVFVTTCLGYNDDIDKIASTQSFQFDLDTFYKRTGPQSWEQTSASDAVKMRYNSRFPGANGLWIGEGVSNA